MGWFTQPLSYVHSIRHSSCMTAIYVITQLRHIQHNRLKTGFKYPLEHLSRSEK